MPPVAQHARAGRSYEAAIVPRYLAVAEGLVARAGLRAEQTVLELAAGTGALTRLVAPRLGPAGRLVVTDLGVPLLEIALETALVAGRGCRLEPVAASVAELPFPAGGFDAVLSSLGPLQDHALAVREAFRVLRPRGTVALAMWGPRHAETRLLNQARRRLGISPFPPADQRDAVQRLARAGFTRLRRDDVRLEQTWSSVQEYLDYRTAFGRSPALPPELGDRLLETVREVMERRARGGPLRLGWTVTYLTARKPA